MDKLMPKSLKTNQCGWTKVFRRIVQQVETDADIRRVVGVENVRSWKGVPGDKMPFAPTDKAPVIRLTPQPRNVNWYSPDSQIGTLFVVVELAVQSLSIDDVIDLYDLVVQCLRPGNGTFWQDLVALGAETGEIVFSDPAFDAQPGAKPEGAFFAVGQMQLRVVRPVNP
jgi:hypothetical protein